jgi:hypothetical protein
MSQSSNPSGQGKGIKPTKPYPAFPPIPHARSRWAKKLRGRLYYFGPCDDPQGVLEDGPLKAYLCETALLRNHKLTNSRHEYCKPNIARRCSRDSHRIAVSQEFYAPRKTAEGSAFDLAASAARHSDRVHRRPYTTSLHCRRT